MENYKIDRKKLFELYMTEVDNICEVCDWKTHFGPEEIVGIISNILEKNPNLIIQNNSKISD